jgi:hypothetical protein
MSILLEKIDQDYVIIKKYVGNQRERKGIGGRFNLCNSSINPRARRVYAGAQQGGSALHCTVYTAPK